MNWNEPRTPEPKLPGGTRGDEAAAVAVLVLALAGALICLTACAIVTLI